MAHPLAEAAPTTAPLSRETDTEALFADELKGLGFDDDDEAGTGKADEAADEIDAEEAVEAEPADSDDTDDEQAEPAIAPPVSWKAEDKELFATLPPEAQRVIAARESERDKVVQTKATEAAEAKRATAQAEAAIGQLHTAYTSRLEQFLTTPEPQAPDPEWLDRSVYGDEGQTAFYKQQAVYEAAKAQRTQAQQEYRAATEQREAIEARQAQAENAEQAAILNANLPGWSDPSTRAKIVDDVTAIASAHGYTAEQLAGASAVDVMILHAAAGWKAKADKYDKLQGDKMTAVRAAKELPKVSRPGVAQARVPAADRAATFALNQLRTGNKVTNPAALFEQYI